MDITGAFLSAPLAEDEIIHMFFRGKMVELIVKTDLKLYEQYTVNIPNGSLMLYTKLKKATHGMLRSSLLFYMKLVGYLDEIGLN